MESINLILILKKITNKFSIFFSAKKDFSILKKKKYLILDEVGSKKIIKLLFDDNSENVNILEDRGRLFNVYAWIFSIKYIFIAKKFSYKHSFIKQSGARVAITFIDTNHHYCQIFKNISDCKLIFIQNGRGASYRYDHVKKNSLENDYYFVNSRSFVNYSKEYIKSNYKIIGSIIANNFKKVSIKKLRKVQWISQYKPYDSIFNKRTYSFKDTFILPTKYYLSIISDFCKENNLKLEIIGLTNTHEERTFYKNFLSDALFRPKSENFLSSYNKLSPSAIVTGMDSQLVYESFAMGYRTAFFSRNYFVNDHSWAFGWPKQLKTYGEYYVNKPNKFKIYKILLNLKNISSTKLRNYYSVDKDVMAYDFDNVTIKSFLKKI